MENINMDRFKFRYYDFRTKNMSYSAEVALFRQTKDIEAGEGVLMQCTGLKDKNEKLVYEGDVVKSDVFDIDVVIYNDGAFKLRNGIYNALNCEYSINTIQVLGNVFENKNLI